MRCEQEGAGGRDVYDLPLPAVVSVLEGLNLPRYPSVPARLRAQAKPVATQRRPARRRRGSRCSGSSCRRAQGKQAEILGDGAGGRPAVVEVLQRLGVA